MNKNKLVKISKSIYNISIALIIIGALMKILHLQFAGLALGVGLLSGVLSKCTEIYLTSSGFRKYLLIFSITVWSIYFSSRLFHLPYRKITLTISIILLMTVLIYDLVKKYKKGSDKREELKNDWVVKSFLGISMIVIITGAILKILSRPYANELLIFGFGLCIMIIMSEVWRE